MKKSHLTLSLFVINNVERV